MTYPAPVFINQTTASLPAEASEATQNPNRQGREFAPGQRFVLQFHDEEQGLTTDLPDNVVRVVGVHPMSAIAAGIKALAARKDRRPTRAEVNAEITELLDAETWPQTANQAITTGNASGIGVGGAVLNGTVSTVGVAPDSIRRGFVVSRTSVNNAPAIGGTGVTNVIVAGKVLAGAFSATVAGLLSNTGHSVRAYVVNDAGTVTYGSATTFNTAPSASDVVAPVVVTSAASALGATTATLNGSVTTLGQNPAAIERGFVIAATATSNNPVAGGSGVTTVVVAGLATGAFTAARTGLTADTGYSYKAFVRLPDNTYVYGTTQTFLTAALGA